MKDAEGSRSDDEVDLVIDAWSGILPDVDLSPLDVMSRLRRVAASVRRVRERAMSEAGLAPWEFEILSSLRTAPRSTLTPSQLGAQIHISSATVAYRIDRLEKRRLIERTADPADSRSRPVRITAGGAESVENAMVVLASREAEVLSAISRPQQDALIALLRELGRVASRASK